MNASFYSTPFRRSAHQSVRSGATRSTNGNNFVRNSLQIQSRDFEQLASFMMRVNPLYDSSEGWAESSEAGIDTDGVIHEHPLESRSEQRGSRSIVMDLGLQTVYTILIHLNLSNLNIG